MRHLLKASPSNGFTLAELLIALSILGVIATFTIPKILQSTSDQTDNSIAKEAVSMVSQAYQAYRLSNTVTSATGFSDLTPYMNYVTVDTLNTVVIDRAYNDTTTACSSTYPCLRLHNGARILYTPADTFGGTGALNSIYFYLDPDGVSNPSTTGPGKSVLFFMYYSGRVTTYGTILSNTIAGGGTYNPVPTADPPWFNW